MKTSGWREFLFCWHLPIENVDEVHPGGKAGSETCLAAITNFQIVI